MKCDEMFSGDKECDLFFDSVEYLVSEEESSVVGEEVSSSCGCGFDVWMDEPPSVEERRERFLQGMGFLGFDYVRNIMSGSDEQLDVSYENIDLERLTQSSRATSSSCSNDSLMGIPDCFRNDVDSGVSGRYEVYEGSYGEKVEFSSSTLGEDFLGCFGQYENFDSEKTKTSRWWRNLFNKRSKRGVMSGSTIQGCKDSITNRLKVRHNRKKWMEMSALYPGQEIQAHRGMIRTTKFSPDGQYLASGGTDGVVRVWRVVSIDATFNDATLRSFASSKSRKNRFTFGRTKSYDPSVIIPDKMFRIEEKPVQEFFGHAGDILDLAWSNSNSILSSSMDDTVRFWKIGCNQCRNVFLHNDYVTCIQFNPVNENYFISGCLDGKVRIWGVSEGRVVDWADVGEVITAVSYRPDGKGFVTGSITGTCRFFETSGNHFQQTQHKHIMGGKKNSGGRITSIQFSPENPQKMMVASEDSRIRIFDGMDVIAKYRGLSNSGCQSSASFTSSEKHIISVGEDNRVYIWNQEDLPVLPAKEKKSVRSCEYFYQEGVTVALPWSGMLTESGPLRPCNYSQTLSCVSASRIREQEWFSFGGWLFKDGPCRRSATWPEEKLPIWDIPISEDDHDLVHQHGRKLGQVHETWSLAIVTASKDGMIRTFNNYGLPVRL